MTEQFDVIEAGDRRPRRWIGPVVVLVLVGAPVVGLLTSREPAAEPGPKPTPTPARTAADRSPDVTRTERAPVAPNVLRTRAAEDGDVEVLDVVFPNGQRAEVRYPDKLGLDRLGSRPFQGVWVGGRYRQLITPFAGEMEVTRGRKPIREFAPNVTLWPSRSGSTSYGQAMLFAFGPWRLAMYDRWQGLNFEDRMALAESLRGKVTDDGYLVLSVKNDPEGGPRGDRSEVRLARPGEVVMGDPAGPQLWFGGTTGGIVTLAPTPGCKEVKTPSPRTRTRGRPFRDVCRGGMRIAALGSADFVTTALDGIRVKLK